MSRCFLNISISLFIDVLKRWFFSRNVYGKKRYVSCPVSKKSIFKYCITIQKKIAKFCVKFLETIFFGIQRIWVHTRKKEPLYLVFSLSKEKGNKDDNSTSMLLMSCAVPEVFIGTPRKYISYTFDCKF